MSAALAASADAAATDSPETATRIQIAATSLADSVVVDCQLPGRVQQLGGMRSYLTRGALTRLPAIDCRTRGGEYTIGDLASGTLSLNRWLPLAEKDDVEAQYYVARIYANGMDGVPVDFAKAAQWYQRAAQKKYAPAMQELGYLYEQGLGVQKDPLLGLNLQRQASGLGEDLEYASTLAANKEEFNRQIAALSDQLAAANSSMQELHAQLDAANDRLLQDGAELRHDQDRLRELRSQLELAKRDSSSESTARVKALQEQLAASDAQVKQRQDTIATLSAQLTDQQLQLSSQLAASQAANAKLNELLASGRSDNEALRARLAQSEQRFIQSQQELTSLRTEYLREADALAARSAELQQIRARGSDDAAALLDLKQRDIDRLGQQIKALETELDAAKRQASAARAGAGDAATHNQQLEDALATLRAQNARQQQEQQAQRADFARLQSQSAQDRAAALASMTEQLRAKASELEDKQRHIATLQLQADQLRDAYDRDRERGQHEVTAANDETRRQQDALRAAQDTIAKQRAMLEQLQMESAASQVQLVQVRSSLSQQAANVDRVAQQRISALEADVRDKDRQVTDLRAQIAGMERQLKPASAAGSGGSAGAASVAAVQGPRPANPYANMQLIHSLEPARYHALIIANGNYRHMPKLPTSGSDAQSLKELLEGRYGFEVQLLTDATKSQIGAAFRGYASTLTDADRLLIYFTGYGNTRDAPPPERAFWAAVDNDQDDVVDWLSSQTLSDWIGMMHARHILLIVDSSFARLLTHAASTVVAHESDERSIKIEWRHTARKVLSSGQDQPLVDTSAPNQNHSLFADTLITVLRQNDIVMTGEMLAHEVSARMVESTARLGLKQQPSYADLQVPLQSCGDFFFVPVAGGVQVASLTP